MATAGSVRDAVPDSLYRYARNSILFRLFQHWRRSQGTWRPETPRTNLLTPILRAGADVSVIDHNTNGERQFGTDCDWHVKDGWIRFGVDFGSATQDTFGPKPHRRFRRNGYIGATIYTLSPDRDVVAHDVLAEKLKQIFESEKVDIRVIRIQSTDNMGFGVPGENRYLGSRVELEAMSYQEAGSDERAGEDSLWSSICLIPFEFDEIK